MTASAPRITQARLNGRIPRATLEQLATITADGSLAPLYLDIRDENGEHVIHLPARVVSLERRDVRSPMELVVEIAMVLNVARRGDDGVTKTTLAQLAAARAEPIPGVPGSTPRRRLSRKELDDRNAAIVRRREQGWPLAMIARQFSLSYTQVSKIVGQAGAR